MKRNCRKALPKSASGTCRNVANSITASAGLMAGSRALKLGGHHGGCRRHDHHAEVDRDLMLFEELT